MQTGHYIWIEIEVSLNWVWIVMNSQLCVFFGFFVRIEGYSDILRYNVFFSQIVWTVESGHLSLVATFGLNHGWLLGTGLTVLLKLLNYTVWYRYPGDTNTVLYLCWNMRNIIIFFNIIIAQKAWCLKCSEMFSRVICMISF